VTWGRRTRDNGQNGVGRDSGKDIASRRGSVNRRRSEKSEWSWKQKEGREKLSWNGDENNRIKADAENRRTEAKAVSERR